MNKIKIKLDKRESKWIKTKWIHYVLEMIIIMITLHFHLPLKYTEEYPITIRPFVLLKHMNTFANFLISYFVNIEHLNLIVYFLAFCEMKGVIIHQ